MRAEHLDMPLRAGALHDVPGRSLLEGFAQALQEASYAPITVRKHIRGAEHFNQWTARKRIPVRNWTEQVLQRFGCHLSRCHWLSLLDEGQVAEGRAPVSRTSARL